LRLCLKYCARPEKSFFSTRERSDQCCINILYDLRNISDNIFSATYGGKKDFLEASYVFFLKFALQILRKIHRSPPSLFFRAAKPPNLLYHLILSYHLLDRFEGVLVIQVPPQYF
jgi:hypothetical protein